MRDPVLFAIPCFLLLLILEWTAARKLESIETAATGQPRPASGAYLTRDSVASISMGLVSIATTAGWKSLALLGYAAIYAYLAPGSCPPPVVHLGDRDRWCRSAVLLLSPHRPPSSADLGYPPGASLQRILQLRHRAAPEVEQQRRDSHVGSAATDGASPLDGVLQLVAELDLPVLGAHRADRQAAAVVRIRLQYPVAPPGPPRNGPGVSGQELWRHPHHLGPPVR